MKTLILSCLAALTLVSCETGPNARTGTVVGGLAGAGLGGIIGSQSGRGLEGAAIGGTIGAVAGNQIGASQDRRNYYSGGRYYDNRYRYSRYPNSRYPYGYRY